MNKKDIYNRYHMPTRWQNKVIRRNNFTYKTTIETIEKYLTEGMKILDIGCGAGTLDFYFGSKGYNVTGIDISSNAIKSCKVTALNLNMKNVTFKAANFPYSKSLGKFDFIILSEVIEHLPKDRYALKQIYRLLKPNGLLFLSTPSKNAPLHKLGITKKFDQDVGHLRRYSVQEISRIIDEAGFKILETKKTEGVFRNFLFVNPRAGKFIRFLKFKLSDIATTIDNLLIKIFGESNYMIIAEKAATR